MYRTLPEGLGPISMREETSVFCSKKSESESIKMERMLDKRTPKIISNQSDLDSIGRKIVALLL